MKEIKIKEDKWIKIVARKAAGIVQIVHQVRISEKKDEWQLRSFKTLTKDEVEAAAQLYKE